MPSPSDDAIYSQDCEMYRYQDQLKWNRLKTAIVIEGGLIVGFAQRDSLTLENWLLVAMIAAGTFLVILVFMLALIDRAWAHAFQSRAGWKDRNAIPLDWPKKLDWISGRNVLWVMGITVTLFNFALIYAATQTADAPKALGECEATIQPQGSGPGSV